MADINGNFFYRESAITTDDIYRYTGRIRRNSYVTITGKGVPTQPEFLPLAPVVRNNTTISSTLPISDTSFDNTYKPNGKNNEKPAAVLQDVSIKLEGTAGSLRRCEVNFLVFNKEDFDTYEKAFLSPGCEVDIEYGYVQSASDIDFGEHTFRVYDFSFELTKENNWKCSFKGVAKGTEYELLNMNIESPEYEKLEFVTDFTKFVKMPVVNIFDWLDYQLQKVTFESDSEGLGLVEPSYTNFIPFAKEAGGDAEDDILTSNAENSIRASAVAFSVNAETYKPNLYYVEGKSYLAYFSLQTIIATINHYVLFDGNNENKFVIRFHPSWSKVNFQFKNDVKIWSPKPLEMIFPYSTNSSYNYYGAISRDDDNTASENTASESEAEILDISQPPNTLAVADNTQAEETVERSAGPDFSFVIPPGEYALDLNNGHPGGILIQRDYLRKIESSFYTKSIDSDTSTEERYKSNGRMPMGDFFVKLFMAIKENSGGAWDLELHIDEKKTTDTYSDETETTIWIVNRKSPDYSNPTNIPVISPASGSNGVREISLNGKIPKEIQARIFAGSRDSDGSVQAVNLSNNPDAEENNELLSSGDLAVKSASARSKLSYGNYKDATSATAVVREIANSLSANEKLKRGELLEPIPYPLDLSITLDGIEGFSFGDTIRVDYLPDRYTTSEGTRIEFTILSYEHKFSNNDWVTSLTTAPRLVTDK